MHYCIVPRASNVLLGYGLFSSELETAKIRLQNKNGYNFIWKHTGLLVNFPIFPEVIGKNVFDYSFFFYYEFFI